MLKKFLSIFKIKHVEKWAQVLTDLFYCVYVIAFVRIGMNAIDYFSTTGHEHPFLFIIGVLFTLTVTAVGSKLLELGSVFTIRKIIKVV
ncbi:MAG: hypothetical protein COB09_18675 [Thalassobium sp.]|nr:MAG: hypothetical protein COB09_18675 [Thalassobium sp.]